MGTVHSFRAKPEDAAAKTEAILTKIGQLYQQRLKAKEELPGVLAALVQAGEADFAMQALVAWGTGAKEAHEILAECETYAAVAGVPAVANRPF
jgi:hypothetical protein